MTTQENDRKALKKIAERLEKNLEVIRAPDAVVKVKKLLAAKGHLNSPPKAGDF